MWNVLRLLKLRFSQRDDARDHPGSLAEILQLLLQLALYFPRSANLVTPSIGLRE